MTANPKAVLGISPGTRIIGLAVISNGELIEWKVKTFKETWSKDKRKAILSTISRMCEYHRIHAIAVKKIDRQWTSPQLDRLVAGIIKQAELQGITAHLYSLSDLDYDYRTGTKQTKDDLTEHVASKHPELQSALLRERNNRKEYHTKMFEAVAITEAVQGRLP